MRVLTVVGARPQFVKAAVVSRALRERHEEVLLHTGQHYDDALSRAFFEDLGLPEPDVRLSPPGGAWGPRMAAMTRGVADAIRARRPDVVLVHGDTDTTLAGAFAARETATPLAHVEAGLRSHNLRMPEEVNRIAADHLSDLLLCPTAASCERLAAEHARGRVELVGDVMLDAFLAILPRARSLGMAKRHGVEPGGYFVATLHRAENVDDPVRLTALVSGLRGLDAPVLLPCHPRTRTALARTGLDADLGALRLLPPLPYSEMLGLLSDARALLTDSGGLQKDAYFLGLPCLTLRTETEWTETVATGWNRLVPADPVAIREAALDAAPADALPDLDSFGGGRTCGRVVAALESAFG
jgi:UDP-GlcNAc3NAcA epimerase